MILYQHDIDETKLHQLNFKGYIKNNLRIRPPETIRPMELFKVKITNQESKRLKRSHYRPINKIFKRHNLKPLGLNTGQHLFHLVQPALAKGLVMGRGIMEHDDIAGSYSFKNLFGDMSNSTVSKIAGPPAEINRIHTDLFQNSFKPWTGDPHGRPKGNGRNAELLKGFLSIPNFFNKARLVLSIIKLSWLKVWFPMVWPWDKISRIRSGNFSAFFPVTKNVALT